MRRNTPIFILIVAVFFSLTGLVLWAYQDCPGIGVQSFCYHPFQDLGSFLALTGTFAVLVAIVLEVFVGLRQTPPEVLPVPPACQACGDGLVYFHDYGLWYCPTCGQYSGPTMVPPSAEPPRDL